MWQAIFPWRVHHVAGAPFSPGHVEYAVGGLSGAYTPPAVDEPGGICLFSWVYAARMMGIFHGALRAHGTGWAIGGCL